MTSHTQIVCIILTMKCGFVVATDTRIVGKFNDALPQIFQWCQRLSSPPNDKKHILLFISTWTSSELTIQHILRSKIIYNYHYVKWEQAKGAVKSHHSVICGKVQNLFLLRWSCDSLLKIIHKYLWGQHMFTDLDTAKMFTPWSIANEVEV